MKESVTYQAILEEGRAEGQMKEAQRLLFLLGSRHLGEPAAKIVRAVEALTDVKQLEELTLRVQQSATWQELLGLNGSSRRRHGKIP
jgi:predicted transposase YdaD